jgi:hypothetical protein
MNFASCRSCSLLLFAFFLLLFGSRAAAQEQGAAPSGGTVPSSNRLQNASFECGSGGYYEAVNSRGETILLPNRWTLVANGDIPVLYSARIFFEKRADKENGSCETRKAHVERIDGDDSALVRALDLETPPAPGKPFDVSLVQQIDAISGTAYSLSGWLLTLCGGSNVPNDCPDGVYMAKMLGVDPAGGSDPAAATVVWAENRNNFVDADDKRIGWSNVRTVAKAQAERITVFARVNSPFQWHGNHGFIDALSLVQAPTSSLDVVTKTGTVEVTLAWAGSLGPDIPTIAGGNFHLYFDVQYLHPANDGWRDLQSSHAGAGSMNFVARCTTGDYQFRVRARAEQPEGQGGVWPNQRYPGAWSTPVELPAQPPGDPPPPLEGTDRVFLPAIGSVGSC